MSEHQARHSVSDSTVQQLFSVNLPQFSNAFKAEERKEFSLMMIYIAFCLRSPWLFLSNALIPNIASEARNSIAQCPNQAPDGCEPPAAAVSPVVGFDSKKSLK
jgi:hypothetical protein